MLAGGEEHVKVICDAGPWCGRWAEVARVDGVNVGGEDDFALPCDLGVFGHVSKGLLDAG